MYKYAMQNSIISDRFTSVCNCVYNADLSRIDSLTLNALSSKRLDDLILEISLEKISRYFTLVDSTSVKDDLTTSHFNKFS